MPRTLVDRTQTRQRGGTGAEQSLHHPSARGAAPVAGWVTAWIEKGFSPAIPKCIHRCPHPAPLLQAGNCYRMLAAAAVGAAAAPAPPPCRPTQPPALQSDTILTSRIPGLRWASTWSCEASRLLFQLEMWHTCSQSGAWEEEGRKKERRWGEEPSLTLHQRARGAVQADDPPHLGPHLHPALFGDRTWTSPSIASTSS